MHLGFKALTAAALLLSSVYGQTITSDTITRGAVTISGDTEVQAGAYWSIINNAITNFVGSLKVDGQLFISSNSNLIALTVTLLGILNSIENNGDISFNSVESLTAPTYNLVGLRFTNNGNMWMGGDGSIGTPVMSVTAANWANNGLMVFYRHLGCRWWIHY